MSTSKYFVRDDSDTIKFFPDENEEISLSGMPAMMMEVLSSRSASPSKIIEKAERAGFNLQEYITKK